ncbi:ArsR family transcriptional regulator [Bifidobacterium animalis subsp. animalis]|uniref:ArsR/SmtB family transcription factor n=1 Tax=Bifidobacterium animalis TaxID=28025 RepID=UPI001020E148|nr:winged helix-turn-helix domain-containing protein [Bifidobacterium animalis]RYN15104.1 ArsR family transcriptional regulator [Bifidobacterium animalis subsp. animalis]
MAKQSAKSTSKGNASAHTAHAELAEDLKKQGAAVFTAESADGNSEEALKCMAHPARMRILGALRVGGVQTVGELSAKIGEAPGAVSYHLAQLEKVGLVDKAPSPDGDKRKSYWRARHRKTAVLHDSADADVIDAFSRTAALTYQMAYERFLDVRPTLPEEWNEAWGADDRVLRLTAEETRKMVAELSDVVSKWERVSEERAGDTVPESEASAASAGVADANDTAGMAGAEHADPGVEAVAVVRQVFRWVP